MAERQPRLFEDDLPTTKAARRGLWIDPADCPHLAWDKSETTWPHYYTSDRRGTFTKVEEPYTTWTWTCCNCGTIRGRVTA